MARSGWSAAATVPQEAPRPACGVPNAKSTRPDLASIPSYVDELANGTRLGNRW